jgi:hypothetical protein
MEAETLYAAEIKDTSGKDNNRIRLVDTQSLRGEED